VSKGGPDATGFSWSLPVVAETWDGILNDINGFHVKPEHAVQALESAKGGPVAEGSIGGGTGMVCFEFKGGMGTASRVVSPKGEGDGARQSYTVGAIVQSNFGLRPQLMIAGVPVGKEIPEGAFRPNESGSIIVAIATDAPLLPHQLKRLARRASHGLARTGGISGNGSGDLFIAFSTANPGVATPEKPTHSVQTIPNDRLDGIFNATVQAVEEAIINSIVANQTMTGANDRKVIALPHDRVRDALKKFGRLR
ncbi:MAG TPA: P1 family peptidase, partial [Chthoniobacterales bacterium]|nr:P1 family peptidase [Chthoniobacterales bacterium]